MSARRTTAERERLIAEARAQQAQGVKYRDIAANLGVSPSTVARWVNPEVHRKSLEAKSMWREQHRARKRAADRAYGAALANECEVCGAPCARQAKTCEQHRDHKSRAVREAIAQMWAEGLSLKDIAQALGTTPGSVQVRIVRMRQDGWDMPYRSRSRATAGAV